MSSSLSSYHYSYPNQLQKHCQLLHQRCKKNQSQLWLKIIGKWAGRASKVPLSKVPRAACVLRHLYVGDGTCSPYVHDVMWMEKQSILLWGWMMYASFFYQPYHPHHPQHPHYLVNPPHPHQILLLLLPFIILQPSKIIWRKCWSPGDHSLSHQEQAQMLYEHIDTQFWHTLPLRTIEPRYETVGTACDLIIPLWFRVWSFVSTDCSYIVLFSVNYAV